MLCETVAGSPILEWIGIFTVIVFIIAMTLFAMIGIFTIFGPKD
jgi:hypothetical protein